MAVGGLQNVMRRGSFTLPPSVISATERFKLEADPLRAFIDERIKPNTNAFVERTEVYVAYTAWATVNGFHQMSAARFYESFLAALTDSHNYTVRIVKRDGYRGYVGIAIA